MGRIVVRYLTQLIFVFSPFIAPRIVTSLNLQSLATKISGIQTPPPEEILRAGVSSFFLVLVFFVDVLDLYLPKQSKRKFRTAVLTSFAA